MRAGRRWYRGDCHVHSLRSQGADQTPAQLVAAARAAGLDFIAVTEHNTAAAYDEWRALAGDDLLVIPGQEVVTGTGHWLALGLAPGQEVEWRYGVRDDTVHRHLAEVRRSGGLCVAAHPHAPYPSGTFMYPYEGFDAVEVWNGQWTSDLPWNADNEAALAEWGRTLAHDVHRGSWRPAIGNSDAHLEGQLGTPHTVALAAEPSTPALLTALRTGRTWIAAATTIDVSFEAHTVVSTTPAGIGERLETSGEPVVVRLEVHGVPSGTVTFHTERGTTHREPLPADGGPGVVEWRTSAAESPFVRAEIRHPNGHMAALTNPIILR
ncbi:CehA/McbA family metallohydrolase [[Actinomadura] parvosata]|uniref:CehA/McbA family metallohydrolase n=1 Tax=[Actinomadura] parvosata TaxID=1955412 RepID=UPI00406C5935